MNGRGCILGLGRKRGKGFVWLCYDQTVSMKIELFGSISDYSCSPSSHVTCQ